MTSDVGHAGPSSSEADPTATVSVHERIATSALAAGGAGLVASAADAAFASVSQRGAGFVSLALADAGVVAPLALAVGVGVGAFAAVVAPRGSSIRTLMGELGAGSPAARAGRSAAVASAVLLGFGAIVVLAHAARAALAADMPSRATGASLAALTVLLTAGVGGASGAASIVASRRVPGWPSSPPVVLAAAGVLVVLLAAAGIASGDTNGGGGFFGILGVLKREELDLRGAGLLSAIAAAAFFGSGAFSRLAAVRSAVLALAPLLLSLYAGGRGLEQRSVALALERGAPLGAAPLAVLRRLTDRDHDGSSARFGGGDCNDHDALIRPGADDVPGNGVDEDCSGEDDRIVSEQKATATASSGNWIKDHFPQGLSVVLVTVDTLRADLGYAGNRRPVSPSIDALARRSVVFDRAYSLASYTGKSLGPMLIGKYPSETSRTFEHFDKFGTDETFVQERLRRAGIRTLTAQGHWYFKPETGIGRGFDDADYSASPKVPQMEGDRTVNGDKLTDAAIALLEKPENVARPFYLWVHYVDPHAAYVPHPEFDFGIKGRDLYDSEVAFVDHHLGRLFAFLEKEPFVNRTAVVLTSDHGEAFGEHGLYRHGFEVWEELVHVPFVVHVPGVAARHVEARRSAVDLVPTLLEMFALPKPEGSGKDFVSGVSLLSDVVSPSGRAPEERSVLVDMCEGPHNAERQAYFDGRYKIIASNGRPIGLYDLDADPTETSDILGNASTADPVVAEFKAFRRTLRTVPPRR